MDGARTRYFCRFPYKIGYDLSGVVVAVGASVSKFKPGDEVYSRVVQKNRGTIAQYAISTESTTAKKPRSLSFNEAASIPLAAQTALQALQIGQEGLDGGLLGKTVFVPGGLSGTGSFAVQLAKNVFGAGKVITTLSTGKIPKIKELLGTSAPDHIVDYTKEDISKAVEGHSIDFMFDTVNSAVSSFPLMKKGSRIVSVSATPSGSAMKEKMLDMPFYVVFLLDIADWILTMRARWNGINYKYLSLTGNTRDLERLATWVDEGKIKPIVGTTVKLSDIEGVRKGCQQIYDGKGGIGKFVIEID